MYDFVLHPLPDSLGDRRSLWNNRKEFFMAQAALKVVAKEQNSDRKRALEYVETFTKLIVCSKPAAMIVTEQAAAGKDSDDAANAEAETILAPNRHTRVPASASAKNHASLTMNSARCGSSRSRFRPAAKTHSILRAKSRYAKAV